MFFWIALPLLKTAQGVSKMGILVFFLGGIWICVQQQQQIKTKAHISSTKLPTTTKPTLFDSPTRALLESTVISLQIFLQMLQLRQKDSGPLLNPHSLM